MRAGPNLTGTKHNHTVHLTGWPFERYGFEIVIGTVTEVVLSVTLKLTSVPFVPAHVVAAVTVNWPSTVNEVVEMVTRFSFEDAVTL